MELEPTSSSSVLTNQVTSGEGGEGSEWLERGDHPLLNNVILTEVLHNVRRYDLKACRGVSQKWNLLSIPHMRATFKVTIYGCQSESVHPDTLEKFRRIEHFVKLFRKNGYGIPIDTFNVGTFCRLGSRFFKIIGETAKEINLIPTGQSDFYVIQHVSKLLRSTPNLQVFGLPSRLISKYGDIVKLFPHSKTPELLRLKKVTFRHDQDELEKYCPTFVQEFIAAAANLSEIIVFDTKVDIRPLAGGANPKRSTISDVLNAIEKLGRELSIQSLQFFNTRNEHIVHLRRLAEKENGLKLRNLTIHPNVYHDDDELQTVERQVQMAEMFKDTLESLDIRFTPRDNLINFPIMPRLKSLTFKVIDDLGPKPVNLNNLFPTLETFDIAIDFPHHEDEWSSFFAEFCPCPNIKSLTVKVTIGNSFNDIVYMRIHTFRDMLRVFPTLTKLDLSGINFDYDSEQNLGQIWSQMTQLESLYISTDVRGNPGSEQIQSADSLFTGIPVNRLEEIRPVVNELEKMTVEERKDRILRLRVQHCQVPSIRNLTNLKFLMLEVVGAEDKSKLTDLTAYLALYSMKHLRHLTVDICGFTKNCCQILRDEMGLESWSFKIGYRDAVLDRFQHATNNVIPSFLLHQTENNYN